VLIHCTEGQNLMFYVKKNAFTRLWPKTNSIQLPTKINTPSNALTTIFILLSTILFGQETLITKGSSWKYLSDGSDQDSAWQKLAFNDSNWSEGLAQLGYGDGDEVTVVDYGSNSSDKPITTYFRHKFFISDTTGYKKLLFRVLKDDGVVLHLNGNEVVRCTHMPTYEIDYRTSVWLEAKGDDERTFFFEYTINLDDLIIGENIIAAEIHQRNGSDPDMSFDLEMILHKGRDFLKQPYLIYTADDSQMRINWQLNMANNCQLQWGMDESYSIGNITTDENTDDHLHQYTIKNLQPHKKYFYRVTALEDSFKSSFVTSPDSSSKNISFIVYGDTRTYPGRSNMVADAMLEYLGQNPQFQTFLLHSGDIVDDGGLEEHWNDEFFTPALKSLRKLISQIPFIAAFGNHEKPGDLFRKYFPLPFVNERFYFSFDYGPAHFAVVDLYAEGRRTAFTDSSIQDIWLENDLANSDKKWKFVVIHRTGWSAGGHIDLPDVQNNIQPLCEKYGVQVVLSGHNHNYARALVNGVQHITSGGGGAPLNPPDLSRPNIVAVAEKHHFCAIKINGDSLYLEVIDTEGNIFDEMAIPAIITSIDNVSNYSNSKIKYELYPAYPNPFNPRTRIKYSIAQAGKVNISIYNIRGQKVITLVDRKQTKGTHYVDWNGVNKEGKKMATGVYFYRIQNENFSMSGKTVLLN